VTGLLLLFVCRRERPILIREDWALKAYFSCWATLRLGALVVPETNGRW